MVITKLFYGLNEIIRIYKDNVIIWESGTKIRLLGFTEIKTYTMGTGYAGGDIVGAGFAEIKTFDKSVLIPALIVNLSGVGVSDVSGEGEVYTAVITELAGNAGFVFYSAGELKGLPIVSAESAVKITTNEDGNGVCLPVVNGGTSDVYIDISTSDSPLFALSVVSIGGDTEILLTTRGYGEAINIVQIPIKEAVQIKTRERGTGLALEIINSEGTAEVKTYSGDALLNLLEILGMAGACDFDTYGVGTLNDPTVNNGVGDAIVSTYTDGELAALDIVETGSEVEIFTDTYGKLSIWYLPFIDTDGTLYIRQAYSAEVVDGVLEVS